MARAIGSFTVSFGLVAIPCKYFTAASSEQVRFNQLHEKCSGRVKQQFYCPIDDEVIERADMVKGYEHTRGQYVVFTDEEMKALEAEKTGSMDIVEFVPAESVDLLAVEKSYYVGPDRGSDRGYSLLAAIMKQQDKIAVCRWATRGKDQLVLLRPYKDGLVMHQSFYSNELRSFDEISSKFAKLELSEREVDLANKLVEQLSSDDYDPTKYYDEYAQRVNLAVQQKLAGEDVVIAPEQPKAQIVDMFTALQKSLDEAKTTSAKDKGPEPKPKPRSSKVRSRTATSKRNQAE